MVEGANGIPPSAWHGGRRLWFGRGERGNANRDSGGWYWDQTRYGDGRRYRHWVRNNGRSSGRPGAAARHDIADRHGEARQSRGVLVSLQESPRQALTIL